jgi:ABC-type bacteriocin/lantibiotic exporter with double-glycine peptidase domain
MSVKYQSRKSSCGPAALLNAVEPLGFARTEDELAILCKTTTDGGTTSSNLIAAVKSLGLNYTVVNEKRFDVARLFLFEHLTNQGTAILCVDNYEHWVTAVGISGLGHIIIDSADENLVLFWSRDQLRSRWASPKFYGLLIEL